MIGWTEQPHADEGFRMAVEAQGWGEVEDGLGAPVRKLLESRKGLRTVVRLASGEAIDVYDVSWGRDFGDVWEHVHTNVMPPTPDRSHHFFHLSEVESVCDPDTGEVLVAQQARPGET